MNQQTKYLMNRIEFDSIRWKLTKNLHPIGKPRVITYVLSMLFSDRNDAGSLATPGWQPRLTVDQSDGVHGRVRAARAWSRARRRRPLFCFGGAG